MKRISQPVTTLVSSSLIVSLLTLAACGKNADAPQPAASDASGVSAASETSGTLSAQPVSAASSYTPPTADQLYQMVAPIALFPDKLVALVLAGSTYPQQITAANDWLAQNGSLKGAALAAAANQQPWDPSVKALTAFPAVLSQMGQNTAWTTSLGEAYVNDPNDVMNAIQMMRLRAQTHGSLKTSQQITVRYVARSTPPTTYRLAPDASPVYAGPAVIPSPPQSIVIEPTQPDIVYVPTYNPVVVYGERVPVYPGYVWQPSVYATGVLSFGIGIAVGAAVFGHYGWGWHAWDVNWGGPGPGGAGWSGYGGPGWQRPAVVYNHTTYVSTSTTVVNHINNTHITNNYAGAPHNTYVSNSVAQGTFGQQHSDRPEINAMRPGIQAHVPVSSTPMAVPHFRAIDASPGAHPHASGAPNPIAGLAPVERAERTNLMARKEAALQGLSDNVPGPSREHMPVAVREQEATGQQHREVVPSPPGLPREPAVPQKIATEQVRPLRDDVRLAQAQVPKTVSPRPAPQLREQLRPVPAPHPHPMPHPPPARPPAQRPGDHKGGGRH